MRPEAQESPKSVPIICEKGPIPQALCSAVSESLDDFKNSDAQAPVPDLQKWGPGIGIFDIAPHVVLVCQYHAIS